MLAGAGVACLEVTRERWPNGIRAVWDEWVLACGGCVTQSAGWVEWALATDYRRALLLAHIGEHGAPEAVAAGFLTGSRWSRKPVEHLHFPAYPSVRGRSGTTTEAVRRGEEAARKWKCAAIRFVGRGQTDASEVVGVLGMN